MKRILIVLTSLSLIVGFVAATPIPASAAPSFSTYGPDWGGSGSGELVVSQFGSEAGTDVDGSCAEPDFNTIQGAVNWAEEEWGLETTIFICNGIYFEQVDSTIGLTLVGEHRAKTILDGANNNNSTVFVAGGTTEQDITVQDLTFRNGDSSASPGHDGGAVWAQDDVYCYNSTFIDNFAADEGGAIYSQDDGHEVYVQDCAFSGNDAEYGGAISADEFSSLRSIFTGNNAASNGGAVYTEEGFGNITDSLFDGNISGSDGGAIHTDADTEVDSTIYRTIFKNNSTDSGGDGGAIYIDGDYYIDLKASSFIGNSANDGGAIYLCADDELNVLATSTAGRVQTLFQGNRSDDDGGAIVQFDCARADLRLTNARFLDNVAGDDGGAVYMDDGLLYVTGSTFTGNRAEEDGGAINTSDDTEIRTSTFTRNSSEDQDGGALSICNDILISSSSFINNLAEGGGAIESECTDSFVVEGSTFVGNIADSGDGGAIEGEMGLASITRSTFRNNSATDDGGALALFYGTVAVLNSTFLGNSAEEAGALWSFEANLELRGNLFQANRGFGNDVTPSFTWNSGAVLVYLDTDTFNIRGNRFISNSGRGVGALYLLECGATPTFDQAAMRSNTWRSNRVTGGEPQIYRDVRTEEICSEE
jgi:predicted outer membrane repeat protein